MRLVDIHDGGIMQITLIMEYMKWINLNISMDMTQNIGIIKL